MENIEEVKTEEVAVTAENLPETASKGRGKKPFNKDNKKPSQRAPRREEGDMDKKVVCVRRVTKVVKGGRTLRFSALVVVGDKKGKVGIGLGKAKEVSQAIEKATSVAKKNMKPIPMVNGTIPHEVTGKFSTTNILMLPAKEGTGVIAGGAARSVLELAGISNIVTKIHGSTNKINCVHATMNGLLSVKTREEIARRRGKNPDEI